MAGIQYGQRGARARGLQHGLWRQPYLFAALVPAPSATAQDLTRAVINRSSVSILTGPNGDLSSRLAADLSSVLDEGNNLRVLAVAGRGALSDIADVLFLHGMDIAIVPANAITYADANRMFPTMKRKLRFVSRLYLQVAHLVAGSGITSLSELAGREINVVSKYNSSFVTAQTIFKLIGLEYEPVFIDQRLAIEKTKRGELAATLILSGRPSPLLAEINRDSRLRIIEIPFQDDYPEAYFPARLTNEDYPNLVAPGETVNSIATTAIMMVYNFKTTSERYAKVARFIDAFLSRLDELQASPRHPRWRDINLTATVRGLQRFKPVTEWLKTYTPPPQPRVAGKRNLRQLFKAFIESQVAAGRSEELLRSNKEELFKRFVAWQRKRLFSGTSAAAGGVAPKPKAGPKRSLRALFQEFIADEVRRIGKANVLALSKAELYQRFLAWRKRTAAN